MTILKMIDSTLEELKAIDPLALAFQKSTIEGRLTIIKNALIIGDLQKDYSSEEIIKLKELK